MSTDAPRFEVLIIGGGFSGTMLAIQLLHRAPQWSIAVVEKNGPPGCGLAYSTKYKFHLLNVPASGMSALPEDPEHFLRWARANYEPTIQSRSFLPRSVYGRYIGSLLAYATGNGNRDRMQWVSDEALSLRRKGAFFAMQLRGRDDLYARTVILATGNLPPADPKIPGLSVECKRYARYAWAPEAIDQLPSDASVLLLGAGLTSADLVISLKSKGHRGKIHIVSRRGLLPLRQQLTPEWSPFWNRRSPRTVRGLLRLIREQVALAAEVGTDWRAVIDSLRPFTQQIWQYLSVIERKRFLRHARTYWEVHRHRLAPEIGDILSDLVAEGQVKIYSGRVTGYREDDYRAEIALRHRHSAVEQVLRVERVINCTGPETDCRRIDNSLLTSLFVQGLARPDSLFLGLDVDQYGGLRDFSGAPSDRLFAVGPLRKGYLWETTAVPEIRAQIPELVEHLLHGFAQRTRSHDRLRVPAL